MNQYIHLIGSEEVGRAGHTMEHAAEQMSRAASSMDSSLEIFGRRMEEWVSRIENCTERLLTAAELGTRKNAGG